MSIYIGLLISLNLNINNLIIKKIFLINTAFYCCIGEFFYPGYHLAYIQLNIVLPLVYSMGKRFNSIFIISFSIIYFIFFNFFNIHNSSNQSYNNYNLDINIAIFSVAILTLFLYLYVESIREEKRIVNKQFQKLGENLSRVVHDIKSGLQAPVLTIDDIICNHNEFSEEELKETLKEVKYFLINKKEELRKVNSFYDNLNNIENIDIIKTVNNNICKLNIKDINYEISFQGEKTINSNKELINSLFLNTLSNSFYYKKNNLLKIIVKVTKKHIIYSDNNGGYPKNILKNLNNGIPIKSNRIDGNGVGLISIKESLNNIDKNIFFFNKGDYSCVKIEI